MTAAVIRKYKLEAERREAQSTPEPWAQEAELAEICDDLREPGACGEVGSRQSFANVVDPTSLDQVREFKKASKAATK